jgi:GT2 family glycosyltransferase
MSSLARKIKKLFKTINFTNLKAFVRYIKSNGLKGLYTKCMTKIRFNGEVPNEYATWIANNEPNKEQLEKQTKYESCQNLKFEIICNDNEELIKSINEQTYSKYIISKLDGKSIKNIVEDSESDYLILVQEDIALAPFALYELVKSIEYRDSILIYSDNDKLINGERIKPHFKPGFARDTIISQNYIGGFIAVKTNFLKIHKEILENLNKNFIYDIVLQISEKTRKIEHIQKILFHELKEEMNIDCKDEKQIIEKYLNRIGLEYERIKDGRFKGHYKIDYKIKGNPKVSIVVPNKDHIEDLDKLLKSIEKSTYSNYEVVVVENNSENKETFEYYDKISKENDKIKIVKFDIKYFNYSAIVNFGVENSNGEYIVLLNNDIEFITNNWIEEMLMYAQRPDVGICGAKLYFEDRSIQHAGVTIGTRGLAGHRFRETEEKDFNAKDYINIVQDLSAVTAACFMVRKQLYIDMLGFDEKLAVAFNDVDFCLKVRTAKYLVVYNPFVEAYHYESKSRGEDTQTPEKQKRFAKEYELFVKRWSKVIAKGDPYYNKNYRLDTDLPKINYNKVI